MGNLLPFAAHFAYNFHFCYAHIFIYMGVRPRGVAQHNIAKGAHFKFVLFILAWALPRDEESVSMSVQERERVSWVAVPATRRECTRRECEWTENVVRECNVRVSVSVSESGWAALLLLLACDFPLSVADFLPTCCQLRRQQWRRQRRQRKRLSLSNSLFRLLALSVCLCWRCVRAMPANFGYLSEQKYF